ncbi:MBL fold metallo-hydrolase [Nocardioides sp. GBK3QG-3]|uniref:MBL fold metallo-hydrolase n=2 Tax=Nocardioides mangrovi TaxID=2874580 RepID=A0ABS7UDS3_9ACTN|nr:MBL fold metallo-hydrolase [Nocardioides mangrovi]
MHVVLLGTAGGPPPVAGRLGISTAIVVDGRVYLVDLGHGAYDQFFNAGLQASDLRGVFVTHLHSDHIADLFTLPWLRFGGGSTLGPAMMRPLKIWGPGRPGALPKVREGGTDAVVHPSDPTPGTKGFIDGAIAAAAYDINIRMRDQGWPDIRTMIKVKEIELPKKVKAKPHGPVAPAMEPFQVMKDGYVTVTATLVKHPPVFPSFGFRFDSQYGSVAISGDTAAIPNVVTLARDTDLLLHEVIDLALVKSAGGVDDTQYGHLAESHTDATEVGGIAQAAGAKKLVLHHLSPGTNLVPDSNWQTKAQQGYDGEVVVGHDLTVLTVGE